MLYIYNELKTNIMEPNITISYKEIKQDKTKVAFLPHSGLGKTWFSEFDGKKVELIYLGRSVGNCFFALKETYDEKKPINNVFKMSSAYVWRDNKKSKPNKL